MTELPFGLKGKIFRSAMPFGTYDPEGVALDEYMKNAISVVVHYTWGQRYECPQQRD
ncbi:MAG: hypothetical protein PHC90_12030 [Syntrophorhabdaceae bacterium]|nr:hypothetical protein [Syntrophorhabdaceae bacterium]